MYIEPGTRVRLLRNVPLDMTYRNTLFFNSASAQQSYFNGLSGVSANALTYQRLDYKLQVDVIADAIYDCNYIMFQNSNYSSKWFYGFITNVEYRNNACSEVTFEIDVLQTWLFNMQLKRCFIDREHSSTDAIGDNLVPDNLELGDYVFSDFKNSGHMTNYRIVVAATFDGNYADSAGGLYGGIYSGLYYNVFANYAEANTFIEGAASANKADGIVSVFMMPNDFITPIGGNVKNYNLTVSTSGSIFEGYRPRNNKLYTYPYNFLYVTNLEGNAAEYRYEYFANLPASFGLAGDMSCNPEVVLYPRNYKGVVANYNEKMTLNGFPQCSYNTDSFKAWLAQNGSSMAINALSAGSQLLSGIRDGNANVALAGAKDAAQLLAQTHVAYTLPPQAHGATGSTTSAALKIKDFAFMPCSITREFAQIIDGYWDVYGYPSHEVKIPNISVRPRWNYTKTVNSCITGNVPADHLAKIRGIFDNGITFWKNGSDVGNYQLNNQV